MQTSRTGAGTLGTNSMRVHLLISLGILSSLRPQHAASTTLPPQSPSPPRPPPIAPAPPLAPGTVVVETADELRVALANAVATLRVFIAPGSVIALGGKPLVVSAINVTISSSRDGAVIDGQGLSRVFHVKARGALALESIHLAHGLVTDDAGGCALVEGEGSVMSISYSSVTNCTARADARREDFKGPEPLLPSLLSVAAGGGIACMSQSVLRANGVTFLRCAADCLVCAPCLPAGRSFRARPQLRLCPNPIRVRAAGRRRVRWVWRHCTDRPVCVHHVRRHHRRRRGLSHEGNVGPSPTEPDRRLLHHPGC